MKKHYATCLALVCAFAGPVLADDFGAITASSLKTSQPPAPEAKPAGAVVSPMDCMYVVSLLAEDLEIRCQLMQKLIDTKAGVRPPQYFVDGVKAYADAIAKETKKLRASVASGDKEAAKLSIAIITEAAWDMHRSIRNIEGIPYYYASEGKGWGLGALSAGIEKYVQLVNDML